MTSTLPEQFIVIPGTIGGITDVGPYGGIGQLDTFQDFGLSFDPGVTEQYLFTFSVPAGLPTVINAWIAYQSGQGTPTLLNYAGSTVKTATNDGDNDRLIYTTTGSSNQFTLVVNDSSLTAGDKFSVVIVAVPQADVNDQNPVGTTEATATQLNLSEPQDLTGQLGLIYQRAAIVTNGTLDYLVGSAVDQTNPGAAPDILNNPTASYHFSLSATGTMTFTNKSNAVVVLHEEPSGPIAVGGFINLGSARTLTLSAGDYYLDVYDSDAGATSGQNGLVIGAVPAGEFYDSYDFTVSLVGGGNTELSAVITSIGATTLAPGATVSLNFRISVAGTGVAAGYGIYLSNSPSVTTASSPIGSGAWFQALPNNGSINLQATVTIPATLAPGTYYISVIADPTNTIGEANPAGNISPSVAVTVAGSAVTANETTGEISLVPATVSQVRSDSANTPYTFTVARSGDLSEAQTADWAVQGAASGSYVAADGADFVGGTLPSGTVSFPMGAAAETITVLVSSDPLAGAPAEFSISLVDPSGASAIGASDYGIIQNANASFGIQANAQAQVQGIQGSTPFAFTVTREGPLTSAAAVNWAVSGTGATPATGADFTGGVMPSGTLTFASGVATQTITVNVAASTTAQTDRTFQVALSGATGGATIADAVATETILADATTLSIAPSNAVQPSGESGATPFTFTVNRAGGTQTAQTVSWAVAGSGVNAASAASFANDVLPSGTVSFAAGATSEPITIDVAANPSITSNLGFAVTLTNPSIGATVANATASGTILSNDAEFWVEAASAAQPASTAVPTAFTFTVTRGGTVSSAVNVNWAVTGTGTLPAAASDFVGGVLPSGTLNFAAGQTSQTITVTVAADTITQAEKQFAVTLSSPSAGATIVNPVATGTILNDARVFGATPLHFGTFYVTASLYPGYMIPATATGINDLGQVVGDDLGLGTLANYTTVALEQGYVLGGGTISYIDYPGSTSGTYVYGIDDANQIAGQNTNSGYGFVDGNGSFSSIAASNTVARGVNNTGTVVGGEGSQGFIEANGTLTTFAVPGAVYTQASGINAQGDIVGEFSKTSSTGASGLQAFLLKGGVYTTLTVPGASAAYANGINDLDQIVGGYIDATNGATQGFVDSGGVFTSIDVPGEVATTANGIDDFGQIVGSATNSAALSVAFLASLVTTPSTPMLTPGSDTGISNTDNVTADTTPVLTGTSDAWSKVILTYKNGSGSIIDTGTTTANQNGAWTFTPGFTLVSGTYAVTATFTDLLGGTSGVSGALALVIDTTTPAAPGALALSPDSDTATIGDDITTVTTPIITGTAAANAVITLYDSGAEIGSGFADNAGNWAIETNNLATGDHLITAIASDLAGNTSVASGALPLTIVEAEETLSIAAVSAINQEATSGVTPFTFQVTRIGDATAPVSAVWTVAGSGAYPAGAADFPDDLFPTGTVTLAAGVTSQGITVDVVGGINIDTDEGFTVTLSGGGAVFGSDSASGTILHNYTTPGRTLAWTGATDTNFTNAGNWKDTTDALSPAVDPPNNTDTAVFSSSGGLVTGSGTVATLSFGGDSSWQAGSAASLTAINGLSVGEADSATLLINGGATIEAGSASVAVAATADGASIGVDGSGSRLSVTGTMSIGASGSGALNVSGGATTTAGSLDAGITAGAVANISVSDIGTGLALAGAGTVGDDGTGLLSVLNGASFSAQSLTIGNQSDSSGALVVSGDNTTLTVSGSLNIGTALGTGDLTVGPGAVVKASVVNLQGGVVLEGGVLDPTVFIENGGSTTGGFGTVSSEFILLEGTILSNGSKAGKQTEVVQGTVVGGGTSTIDGTDSVNGPGILQIGTHDTIELTGAVLNDATTTFTDNLTPTGTYTVNNSVVDVVFQDSTGVLQLDDIAGFAGTVATWKAGDSFVVTGGTLSNLRVSNSSTLTFQDSGTGAGAGGIDSIIFGSGISAAGFNIVNGDTVQAVACFAEGTRIRTAHGDVAVENLALGDGVITNDDAREPIVWLGRRAVNCRAHPRPETVWPVRVCAGAFAENVPARDLYLSPDHAVFVNGVLVPVKLLIDSIGFTQVKHDRVTYYHVELPRHAIILAEHLPVESYLDLGDRANFDEDAETIRLFPDFAARLLLDTAVLWETRGAAPMVMTGEGLAVARRAIESAARVGCGAARPMVGSRPTKMSAYR